jgi:hypothetical protein
LGWEVVRFFFILVYNLTLYVKVSISGFTMASKMDLAGKRGRAYQCLLITSLRGDVWRPTFIEIIYAQTMPHIGADYVTIRRKRLMNFKHVLTFLSHEKKVEAMRQGTFNADEHYLQRNEHPYKFGPLDCVALSREESAAYWESRMKGAATAEEAVGVGSQAEDSSLGVATAAEAVASVGGETEDPPPVGGSHS